MDKVAQLIRKGAEVPDPQGVFIGDEVDLARVAGRGVTLFPGTRIRGRSTFIAEGAQIGAEGPAVVAECHVGPRVSLKGGFFSGAVFLAETACGLGAHVRQGTIMEEGASVAHTVGLKQTILFPFVTLGSLINFCDCLMAGGTGRDNHSEVGSSYIHFNFTPNQDKATPSLIGDVPRGVMLNQPPVFLGGQGGLVGPCRLAYGTVTAAGIICRHDQLKENHLVLGGRSHSGSVPYTPGKPFGLNRILENNFQYIGNLYALRQWYARVRAQFAGPDLPPPLLEGLKVTLQDGVGERIKQLGRLADKLDGNSADDLPQRFAERWPEIKERLIALQGFEGEGEARDRFLETVDRKAAARGRDYLAVIQSLDPDQAAIGTRWLSGIVHRVLDETGKHFAEKPIERSTD
jgi:bifunctional UDP-N-acetylglucosamine pyrophosphorylase / glucosamine-1-phosphate N-acetyltransferase